mmetsp:Transcript_25818/g.29492  ORF Transcript_25818/g.29492 Transcript_25818/m.29492 type:complete len:1017 (+) Transcript_25818:302-3352(+)
MVFSIKLQLNGTTRRIRAKPQTFEELTTLVANMFDSADIPARYVLQYQDDEEEMITVDNNLDLKEAYQVATECNKQVLKFQIVNLERLNTQTLDSYFDRSQATEIEEIISLTTPRSSVARTVSKADSVATTTERSIATQHVEVEDRDVHAITEMQDQSTQKMVSGEDKTTECNILGKEAEGKVLLVLSSSDSEGEEDEEYDDVKEDPLHGFERVEPRQKLSENLSGRGKVTLTKPKRRLLKTIRDDIIAYRREFFLSKEQKFITARLQKVIGRVNQRVRKQIRQALAIDCFSKDMLNSYAERGLKSLVSKVPREILPLVSDYFVSLLMHIEGKLEDYKILLEVPSEKKEVPALLKVTSTCSSACQHIFKTLAENNCGLRWAIKHQICKNFCNDDDKREALVYPILPEEDNKCSDICRVVSSVLIDTYPDRKEQVDKVRSFVCAKICQRHQPVCCLQKNSCLPICTEIYKVVKHSYSGLAFADLCAVICEEFCKKIKNEADEELDVDVADVSMYIESVAEDSRGAIKKVDALIAGRYPLRFKAKNRILTTLSDLIQDFNQKKEEKKLSRKNSCCKVPLLRLDSLSKEEAPKEEKVIVEKVSIDAKAPFEDEEGNEKPLLPRVKEEIGFPLKEEVVEEKPEETVESESESKPVVHQYVTCDECDAHNIEGIRYKCAICRDFDLCEKCEVTSSHDHPFLKIRKPEHAPRMLIAVIDDEQNPPTGEDGNFFQGFFDRFMARASGNGFSPRWSRPRGFGRNCGNRRNQCGSFFGHGGLFTDDKPKPLRCTFIEDIGIKDGDPVPTNAQFIKTWRIKNSGESQWPENCVFTPVGENTDKLTATPLPSLRPGQEHEVSVTIPTPDIAGRFATYWRASGPNGQFGDRLWADVEVVDPEEKIEAKSDAGHSTLSTKEEEGEPIPTTILETSASFKSGNVDLLDFESEVSFKEVKEEGKKEEPVEGKSVCIEREEPEKKPSVEEEEFAMELAQLELLQLPFGREQIREALIMANGDIELAASQLLG